MHCAAWRLNPAIGLAEMPRYQLTIEYNGAAFHGWQKQADLPSVQETLEAAVCAYAGHAVSVVGAGRTDAGVHAYAQVAHVDICRDAEPFSVQQGINFYLITGVKTRAISVIAAQRVADDFHARFHAVERRYAYHICNRRPALALEWQRSWQVPQPLDAEAMQAAAQRLVGTHDFTSFRASECQAKSPIKTLDALNVQREGDTVIITARARSFLHHQVRNIVGTLAYVGHGKWSAEDVSRALAACDRKAGGPTAPADGLYLTGVGY